MNRGLKLFIAGEEVDLQKNPDILYTYQIDDLLSPATVRNTYSKSVTLPSTARNHRVFGHIFEGDEVDGYDASKKADFVLYNGNEVYEQGYCRLTSVKRVYNETTYEISLYGGLGSLFSNLTFKDEEGDDKKSLSDLNFGGGQDELDFDITKETVRQAWQEIDDPTSKFNIVSFAPCYEGLPEDFSADKVLVYTGQQQTTPVSRGGRQALKTTVESDGKTYTTFDGYVLAELPDEMTADEVRDWRSYMLRPMFNVKRGILACADPVNNGGFEVELDSDFFNDNNPYWSQAWVTLPRLTSLDYVAKTETVDLEVSLGGAVSGRTTEGDPGYYEDRALNISGDTSGNLRGMRVKVDVSLEALFNSAPGQAVYPSAKNDSYGVSYMSSVFLQLVAYDTFGNPISSSDLINCTSAYGTRRITQTNGRTSRSQIVTVVPTPSDYDFAFFGESYRQAPGGFIPVSGHYVWRDEITGLDHMEITIDDVPQGANIKLLLTKVYRCPSGASYNNWATLWKRDGGVETTPIYTPVYTTGFRVTLNSAQVFMDSNEGIRSGARITKKTLLSTDYTPAEFLLSYCKLFGLYFLKDPIKRKVTIMPRSKFFQRDEIVDIQDQLDRSSEAVMVPLAFDKKWYKWGVDGDGDAYKTYKDTYGKNFGDRLVNTGFQFNSNTEDVLSNNVFKNACQVLERNPNFCVNDTNPGILPWRFGGFTYLLYYGRDDTYEVEYRPISTIDLYTRLGDTMYYDVWDKLQLHTEDNSPMDGSGILCFYAGMKSLLANGKDPGYILSDDNSIMALLNEGEPCWLSSYADNEVGTNVPVCIHITEAPQFSRYIRNDVGNVILSWDFAVPDTFYIPNTYETEGTDIYSFFWRDYIKDLYDPNTRTITYRMKIKGKPDVNWLRKFYWFDNAIWRISEINDWNASEEDLTEVVFVRVNDKANYTSDVPTTGQTITLTPSKDFIEADGETITIAVNINDGGSWTIRAYDSNVTFSATGGTGNSTVSVTFPANSYVAMIRPYEILAVGDNGASATIVINQDVAGFSWSRVDGGGDIPASGGTVIMQLVSELDWSVSAQGAGVTMSPSSGTSTQGTQITFTIPENNTEYVNEFKIYANNSNGAQMFYTLHQMGTAYIRLYPSSGNVAASGGTVRFGVECNFPMSEIRLSGFYDEGTSISVDQSEWALYLTVPANNTGYDRNFWFILGRENGNPSLYSSYVRQPAQ